jgi:hypothetical protein
VGHLLKEDGPHGSPLTAAAGAANESLNTHRYLITVEARVRTWLSWMSATVPKAGS